MKERNEEGCLDFLIIKMVWQWHKGTYADQWKTTDSPEINSYISGQMIFNKGAKTITKGKEQFLPQMVLGKLGTYLQKNEHGPLSYTIYKN